MEKYTIGIDYGTDSVRSVIVNTANGKEVASSVYEYPRWKAGKYCDAPKNKFRQHPLDYLEGLEQTIRRALAGAPDDTADKIAGISIDTTGSTPVAVNRKGTPLAMLDEFSENPNAMFILWKDHTAVKEAEEINHLSTSWGGTDFTMYEGGIYSSEWFWAKILHVTREDEKVRKAAWSWVEHCDWIPAILTGITDPLKIKRSRCAAGHKAMWHPNWNGLPSEEFLVKLDPVLKGLRDRLYQDTYTSDEPFGQLTGEWAEKLGLKPGIPVGVGAFDAHLGAIGGEIKPYYLSKVMGTSTCDMLVAPMEEMGEKLIRGICGQVDGSITPGMLGMEAGQSAFGDVYAWFRKVLMWPVDNILGKTMLIDETTRRKLLKEIDERIIPDLTEAAQKIPPEESGVIALDWMNGRRTPDANQLLKGVIAGITLGTDAPRIFRALVEATAFGAKKIVERFRDEGVRIDGVIALGGVAKKSPFVMQTVANVLNMPILVAKSDQTCALGSAMAASVVAGIHDDFIAAQQAMGSGFDQEYTPEQDAANAYAAMYVRYNRLGDIMEKDFY
ncbi:MAG: ribulokinase [Bacteroidales bacterium]